MPYPHAPVIAAYSGTFDPPTLGHADIIGRAAAMFPRVIVAVGMNAAKNPRFSLEERVALVRAVAVDHPNVEVEGFSGLIAEFAADRGITVLVRGVRNGGDVDYERQMAVMNRGLYTGLDTIMLCPDPALAHLSSSLVRELATLGAPVETLVHPAVMPLLLERFGPSHPIQPKADTGTSPNPGRGP